MSAPSGGPEPAAERPEPELGALAGACQILAEAAISELRGLAMALIEDATAATRQVVQDGAGPRAHASPTPSQAIVLGAMIGAVATACLLSRGAHARP